MAHEGMDYVDPIVVIDYQRSSFPMTTQTRIFLAKRYIEDLLQEIPDKISAYVWQDLRLIVYSGRQQSDILFTREELLEDNPEARERLKGKVKEEGGAKQGTSEVENA